MTLSDLSIRKPVFAWMLMFALIVFGAISFSRMGISEMPDVDFPVVSVTARYPGAAPQVIEADVLDPLEDAIISIQGVRNITSRARNGVGDISVEFDLSRDIDLAFQDVQAKIAQVQAALPRDLEPVTLMKTNPEDFPILWLSVSNPDLPPQDLMTLVKDEIRARLTTIPGVGSIWTPGYVEPNLRVWVNNEGLKQYSLTVSDVVDTLRMEQLEAPSGRAEFRDREYSLRTLGEEKTPSEIANIYINTRGGRPNYRPIQIHRVAEVQEGTEDVLQFARANGVQAVGLGIVKQRGANAVAVARAIKERVGEIQDILPPNTTLRVNFDGTKFVEESVAELILTLVLAAIFTSLVCWMFLGSWSTTFNVLMAIPTSVLGSFIVLYFSGFTLNIFTLLGLSLAIGIVVDDAIMVLENIMRHYEAGKDRKRAALVGAREITFAAMAASVSLVAIFLPIVFMEGLIGRFLFQFGVTMSAAIMISLLEALTLAPMRASRFAVGGERRTRLGRFFEWSMDWTREKYAASLAWALDNRKTVLGASAAFFLLSFASIGLLKGEFQPPQDQSALIIQLNNPPGSSLSFTDARVKAVEEFLSSRQEVESFFAAGGGFTGGQPNSAVLFVALRSPGERESGLSQQEFIEVVREHLTAAIPEAKPQVQDPSIQGFGGGGGRGFPVEFSIQGPDWETLSALSGRLSAEMRDRGLMTDVDSNLQLGAPEIRITPDRQKASARGVSVASIGETINAMLGGAVAGSYEKQGHRYDIRVKLLEEEGRSPVQRIREFMIRNNRGELVPLVDVVDIRQAEVPAAISRLNRQRSIMIYGNIAPGHSQQEVLREAERISGEILPAGYTFSLSGTAQEFRRTFSSLIFALILGFVVAYMILASQFNSFIDPVTIFMALPFSFSGAFLFLLVTGQSMNVFSMIGLILLMGIVKKNSILLVEFTHQRRDNERISAHEALLKACPTRLRPILMTSVATIAGALPAALAFGPGAEARQPMAIAVIGGVFVSTLLTLYVVPCTYCLFARFDKRAWQREEEALERRRPPRGLGGLSPQGAGSA